jgi:uncharacterized protein (UPF0147 family)
MSTQTPKVPDGQKRATREEMEKAVSLLDNVTAQVSMPRAGHVAVQEAIDLLRRELGIAAE